MNVKIVPWGSTANSVKSFTTKLSNSSRLKSYQKNIAGEGFDRDVRSALRLLSVELTSEPAVAENSSVTLPKSYIAKYYDYNRNCSLVVRANPRKECNEFYWLGQPLVLVRNVKSLTLSILYPPLVL